MVLDIERTGFHDQHMAETPTEFTQEDVAAASLFLAGQLMGLDESTAPSDVSSEYTARQKQIHQSNLVGHEQLVLAALSVEDVSRNNWQRDYRSSVDPTAKPYDWVCEIKGDRTRQQETVDARSIVLEGMKKARADTEYWNIRLLTQPGPMTESELDKLIIDRMSGLEGALVTKFLINHQLDEARAKKIGHCLDAQ